MRPLAGPLRGRCGRGAGELQLPGELELGRGAGRTESRDRGGAAEVLEALAHDLAIGEELDEASLAAAVGARQRVDLENPLQQVSLLRAGRAQGLGSQRLGPLFAGGAFVTRNDEVSVPTRRD